MADTKFNLNFGAMYNFGNFDFGSFDASINPGRDLAGLDPLRTDQYFGRGFTAYPYFDYSFGRNPNLRGIVGMGYMANWITTDPKKVATQLRSQEVPLNEDAVDALGGGSNDNNNDADTLSTNRTKNMKVHANHVSQNIHARLGLRTLNDRLVAAALFGFANNTYDNGGTDTFKDDAKAELMGIDKQGNPTPRNGADILLQTIRLKSAGLHVSFFPDKLSTDPSKKTILSLGISAGYMADWGGTTESINQDSFKKSADDPFRTPGFTHHKGLLGATLSWGPNGSRDTSTVDRDPLPPTAPLPADPAPAVDNDRDNDGLTNDQEKAGYANIDGVEYNFPPTKPGKEDSDNDGLTDYEEVVIYGTNPRDDDSDHDGLKDGQEVSLAKQYADSKELDFNTVWDIDGDGKNNAHDADSDNDAKDDRTEYDMETTFFPDIDGDGIPMYYDTDSDNDTLLDKKEYADEEAFPIEDGDNKPAVVDTDSDDDYIMDGDDTGEQADGRPNYLHKKEIEGVRVTSEKVEFTDKIHFDTNSDRIQERSYELLNNVAQAILQHEAQVREKGHVEIQGHTDKRGSDRYNLELSDRRANSVKRYLLGRGVPSDLLESKGYGESQLIDTANTSAAHDQNRRVEFIITDGTLTPAATPAEPTAIPAEPATTVKGRDSISITQNIGNKSDKIVVSAKIPDTLKGDTISSLKVRGVSNLSAIVSDYDVVDGKVVITTTLSENALRNNADNTPQSLTFDVTLADGATDRYSLKINSSFNQTELAKKGSGGGEADSDEGGF